MKKLVFILLALLPLLLFAQGQQRYANEQYHDIFSDHLLTSSVFQQDTSSDDDVDHESPWQISPRHPATQFLHSAQSEPEYGVVIEFLPERHSDRFHKNLINPHDLFPWYDSDSSQTSTYRVSGWKESNLLYVFIHSLNS